MIASDPVGLELVRLDRPDDVDGWRRAAREKLLANVPPEAIVWEAGEPVADLFGALASADSAPPVAASSLTDDPGGRHGPVVPKARPGPDALHDSDSAFDPASVSRVPSATRARAPRVPRAFMDLAERVVCHRDADRFGLLYRVLWRITHGEPGLLSRPNDPDVFRLHVLGKRVARERHKMHAFVRFRQTPGVEPEHFGAWFEPELHTLRLSSGFFVRRFANMRWSIVTPEESAHWDTEKLVFGPGGSRGDLPDAEAMETLWRTYFANIFNPARLRLDAMRSEMPVKYWKNLPEAPLIAELVHKAGTRTTAMIDAAASTPPRFAAQATHPAARVHVDTPVDTEPPVAAPVQFADLESLHAEARRCRACEHACRATTAVNGEGPADARLMLVGEQAGDREDLAGRPFVGPAGALLRGVLEELDVDPATVFLTNAVRHFRHEVRGKRRLHRTPTIENVSMCRTFLFEEVRLVRPDVVVALGATAGRALLGRPLRVNDERGQVLPFGEGRVIVPTAHPASILRTADDAARRTARAALRDDLALAVASARGQAA